MKKTLRQKEMHMRLAMVHLLAIDDPRFKMPYNVIGELNVLARKVKKQREIEANKLKRKKRK